MYEVQKRDGKIAEFDIAKISSAIAKAFDALEKQYHPSTIDLLALNVTAHFEPRIKNGIISVEDVQDSVEEVLSTAGYADVAKSYILYRKQREKVRNANATLLDYKDLVDQYVKVEDWRVKENSTVTYSVGGLILSNSGAITANYWLSEIYDDEVAKAHRNADIHLHDLSMLTGYCAGWSLKQLIQEGLGGVPGKITSKPANHLSSLCNQMVNFLGIMQNEWAGAQAFSSFDTYLAPFVKADNLTYEETKQCVESFVFGVNTPSRWGTQAPFSNITLDWVCPADLRDQPAIVGGKEMDFTYGDCKVEMDMVNKAFIEIMIEGDANGRGFSTNPHVLHHARLRLERNREQPAAVRNDLEVRHSVLLQLHQLRHGTVRRAFHVLPPAPRPARAAQEVGRFLRQRRVHGLHRRGHHQHAAPGLSVRRRSRLLPSTRPSHGRFRALAAHEARSGHAPAGCGLVPVHQALPGHVREPLLHDRPGGHERGVPERAVAAR